MLIPSLPKSSSTIAASLIPLLLFDSVQGQASTSTNNTEALTGFPPCDALIAANLSHAVHLPSSPLYPSLVGAYWSLGTRRRPWCFVLPESTAEVSETLSALNASGNGPGDWHIAIRSGGHGSDESNNIKQGVTIDLSQLNATIYDATSNIASVGTGARWANVYADLEKDGVSVTGGREGVVGVGGFLLGGGNSWYTARTGFACDSVINYEVVLASGTIINANASMHSDLWQALKGGGSNFGIVTRFDIEAFPATNLTIETRTIGIEHADEFVDAIAEFTNLNQTFQNNAMISLVSYDPDSGDISMQAVEVNTMNDGNSTAFEAFNRIPTLVPATKESLTLPESANRSQLAGDTRNAGFPLTIVNDPQVMRYCIDQHTQLVADLNTTIDISVKKGGNMLGLERDPRNKIIFIASVTLLSSDSEDQYPGVYQQLGAMMERIRAFSKSVGSSEEFIYLNYADSMQDPLGSYGTANVDHMKQVASKYDPHGVFQRRIPGGFKIGRVA